MNGLLSESFDHSLKRFTKTQTGSRSKQVLSNKFMSKTKGVFNLNAVQTDQCIMSKYARFECICSHVLSNRSRVILML